MILLRTHYDLIYFALINIGVNVNKISLFNTKDINLKNDQKF